MTENEIFDAVRTLSLSSQAALLKLLEKKQSLHTISSSAGKAKSNVHHTTCPYCKGINVVNNGKYRNHQKYKCKDCKRVYNELTGTTRSNLKKVVLWNEYVTMLIDSVRIREAASKLNVSTRTIFDWRHKINSILQQNID